MIVGLPQLREAIAELDDDGRRIALGELRLLSPVANPGELFAAPVNYKAHRSAASANSPSVS